MKARSLSVCVDVYQPWSRLSLVEVAAQCLKTNPPKTERDLRGRPVCGYGRNPSVCMSVCVCAAQRSDVQPSDLSGVHGTLSSPLQTSAHTTSEQSQQISSCSVPSGCDEQRSSSVQTEPGETAGGGFRNTAGNIQHIQHFHLEINILTTLQKTATVSISQQVVSHHSHK
ncbi:2-succinyl-5-enolpyruvyl-6-hydroxy-3-cyclohexene-1-carboxylate synthase [Dissostichus eleginoides]|uniref:2-succinyl-5-enolpyruvyl-6-hydroxy-3-cyclohexene-1-carboxylate synthase n=1 Tax=Dissostichus eleginoides TaxID=100907 RepID=A0AAD9BNA4_DISEL|nr:2-succinyl-5-enolpyruvyl-6-hydroxy-3-cyclohexene-1-carboxylate synthase [Dissostichus eleginoides]